MKQEAAGADKEVSNEGNDEYGIVPRFSTAEDTLECKENEHEVCQSIDDLGSIRSRIIILGMGQLATLYRQRMVADFFTPVNGRSHRIPVSRVWRIISPGRQITSHRGLSEWKLMLDNAVHSENAFSCLSHAR